MDKRLVTRGLARAPFGRFLLRLSPWAALLGVGLYAAGRLGIGETLRHRSIVDSVFAGRVIGETTVAGRPAVITEVEGSARLTGRSHFVLDPTDPLGTGFLLR